MPSVVFMGTPDFAAGVLHSLIDSEYEVTAVFTQPDKPRGRSGKPAPSPVKEAALEAGIEVYQPKKIRTEENVELIRKLAPDAIVVAAFGQIIPKAILDIPQFGCINVHASLLPRYRGAAPIQWAVINGDEVSGVTIMQMGEGLDTGDILYVREVPLLEDETGGSLFDKLSRIGAETLVEALHKLEEGSICPVSQPDESPTPYASMLRKEMGLINWADSARKIERLVRGLNPWPSAYTYLDGKQLKIWASKVEQMPQSSLRNEDWCSGTDESSGNGAAAAEPGTILWADKEAIYVQTGEGILKILELQLEGKKRMPCDAFLRGFHVEAGTLLGRA